MDPGSISSTDQGNRGWARELLGSAFQYSLTVDCSGFASEECQRPALSGGIRRFHFYYCAYTHANKVDGSTELLNTIYP